MRNRPLLPNKVWALGGKASGVLSLGVLLLAAMNWGAAVSAASKREQGQQEVVTKQSLHGNRKQRSVAAPNKLVAAHTSHANKDAYQLDVAEWAAPDGEGEQMMTGRRAEGFSDVLSGIFAGLGIQTPSEPANTSGANSPCVPPVGLGMCGGLPGDRSAPAEGAVALRSNRLSHAADAPAAVPQGTHASHATTLAKQRSRASGLPAPGYTPRSLHPDEVLAAEKKRAAAEAAASAATNAPASRTQSHERRRIHSHERRTRATQAPAASRQSPSHHLQGAEAEQGVRQPAVLGEVASPDRFARRGVSMPQRSAMMAAELERPTAASVEERLNRSIQSSKVSDPGS